MIVVLHPWQSGKSVANSILHWEKWDSGTKRAASKQRDYSTIFCLHTRLKGPYALIRSLLACTCGTQHWAAIQHIHNYACSRTVYVLHTRVVTVGLKHVGILIMNKKDFCTSSAWTDKKVTILNYLGHQTLWKSPWVSFQTPRWLVMVSHRALR